MFEIRERQTSALRDLIDLGNRPAVDKTLQGTTPRHPGSTAWHQLESRRREADVERPV